MAENFKLRTVSLENDHTRCTAVHVITDRLLHPHRVPEQEAQGK